MNPRGPQKIAKRQPFHRRVLFAARGVRHALRSEASFRTQILGALAALALLIAARPAPIWWATLGLTTAGVLAAELMNTALELVVDRLHPESDPGIGMAKDCAAGAVLVLSAASLAVAVALILETWGRET